jgi:23S rRNA pseudouridine1911/1915/1917 synthase
VSDTFVVPRVRAGMELDEFLCLQYPDCNKGFIRQQIRGGHVLLDGIQPLPSKRLHTDQVLYVTFDPEEASSPPVAPEVAIPVLHETDDWLVVDKPADLAVEPERWARENASLSGALLQLMRERSATEGEILYRLRLVHRIDKDTSGAVLVAKNIETERFLRTAFEEGRVRKRYLALVEGEHPLADGETLMIDLPLGSDERKSGRVMVRERDGKSSRTRIEVETRFLGYTLLACEPVTGRTHQIRVHLSEAGFPLAVDPMYGRRDEFFLSAIKSNYKQKAGKKERPLIGRLTLHASRIGVPTPDGDVTWVEAPLPKDLRSTLNQLEKLRRWNR